MNDDLRALLQELDPMTRDTLRRVLIHDQAGGLAVGAMVVGRSRVLPTSWVPIFSAKARNPASCSASVPTTASSYRQINSAYRIAPPKRPIPPMTNGKYPNK